MRASFSRVSCRPTGLRPHASKENERISAMTSNRKTRTRLDRRTVVAGLSASLLLPRHARAATVTDGAGRAVAGPARVGRAFAAGPPAAITLYAVPPDALV